MGKSFRHRGGDEDFVEKNRQTLDRQTKAHKKVGAQDKRLDPKDEEQ